MIIVPSMKGMFGGGVSNDPCISNVKHLTHFNGANGSTTYTQSIGANPFSNVMTAAALSTTQSFFNGSSLKTVSGGGVACNSSAGFTIGSTQDYCAEFFVRPDGVAGTQVYFDMRPGNTSGIYAVLVTTGTTLRLSVNSIDRITGGTLAATTKQFIAVCRANGNTRLYLGTVGNPTAAQIGSTFADSLNYGASADLRLGISAFGANTAPGYYGECRLTIGPQNSCAGRYSGTTCPIPIAPFPDQ